MQGPILQDCLVLILGSGPSETPNIPSGYQLLWAMDLQCLCPFVQMELRQFEELLQTPLAGSADTQGMLGISSAPVLKPQNKSIETPCLRFSSCPNEQPGEYRGQDRKQGA